MTVHLRRVGGHALLIFSLLVASLTVGAAPAAAAGEPAHNHRVQELTFEPHDGNRACVSRRIYLATSDYARNLEVEGLNVDFRQRYIGRMHLGAGFNCSYRRGGTLRMI